MSTDDWCQRGNSTKQETCPETFGDLTIFIFYTSHIHVSLSSVICTVGALGNLILVTVLLRPAMLSHGGHGAVHVILASVAVTDLITDITNLIYVIGRSTAHNNQHHCGRSYLFFYGFFWNLFVLIHADGSVFLHALSLYLTVVLAYLRVRVLYSGNSNSRNCGTLATHNEIKAGIKHIIGTTLFVGLFCVPNFMRNTLKSSLDTCWTLGNKTVVKFDNYEIYTPSWWNSSFEKFNFWTNGIMSKIIPCFLLTLFMALLVHVIIASRNVRRRLVIQKPTTPASASAPGPSLHSSGDRTTTILLVIVFIFWLTELPQGILLIGSAFHKSIFHIYRVTGDALDLLSLINSTVNFVLYCSMSTKFRQEFAKMFRIKNSSASSEQAHRCGHHSEPQRELNLPYMELPVIHENGNAVKL